jgi:hypothetical protein
MRNMLLILCGLMLLWMPLSGQIHQISFNHVPPAMPVVNAGVDTTVYCSTPFVLNGSVASGTPPFTFLWQPGQYLNDSTILNPTGSIASDVVFTLTITDSNGCVDSDEVHFLCIVNSVPETNLPDWRIYPNPTTGFVMLQGLTPGRGAVEIRCYNPLGKLLLRMEEVSTDQTIPVDLRHLAPGLYLIQINDGSTQQIHRVIIQH